MTDSPIRFDSIIAFMTAVKSKTECPFCGGTGWTVEAAWDTEDGSIMSDVTALPYAPLPSSEDPNVSLDIYPRSFAVIPFVCNQCGFVRTHSYGSFKRWLDQHRSGAEWNNENPEGRTSE